MSTEGYERIECLPGNPPQRSDPAVAQVLDILMECADGFAERCRADPRHAHDRERVGRLLCAIGIGHDEATGFLRALDTQLITLTRDGNFRVSGARACSPNLHVVGREGDGVKLHNEVLIHVTAYADLVLDHGWEPTRLVFDPFFASDALDLWGYADAPSSDSWRDGDIVFAAEAKSRVDGADGLRSLLRAFERLNEDPSGRIPPGLRRKWEEVMRLATPHPIELLLAADGARWWYIAETAGNAVRLELTKPTPSA